MSMKYVLLLALIVFGAYFYAENQNNPRSINTYQELLDKLDESAASVAEVKKGANLLAKYFCSDGDFQAAGGATEESCMAKYQDRRERCEKRLFPNGDAMFSNKTQVVQLVKRYTSCVGASE